MIALRPRSEHLSGSELDAEFHAFVRRFLPTLLKGAFLLTRDIDLAEDVVQATLLRVFKHWSDARNSPEYYSRHVLLNVCRDHWRRTGRRPKEAPLSDSLAADDGRPFSDRLADREALKEALNELPEQQREVLVLRFYFDLSVSQTAEILGIAEGTVKSAVSRGKQHLHDLLKPSTTEAEAC